jgi:hypothetical protein
MQYIGKVENTGHTAATDKSSICQIVHYALDSNKFLAACARYQNFYYLYHFEQCNRLHFSLLATAGGVAVRITT